MRTLILGLGSDIRRDDAVGLLVARQLRCIVTDRNVDVLETSVAGWSLVEMIVGYDKAVIIDSVCTAERRVGRLHRLCMEDLGQWADSLSPHRADLASVMEAGKAIGMAVPADVVIYAVEVSDPLGYATELTDEVQTALPGVVAHIAETEFHTSFNGAAAASRPRGEAAPRSALTGGLNRCKNPPRF